MSARLSEILDDARSLHSATEAAQLSDISWLTNELDALDVPRDGVWRARIDILRNEVYQRLGDFQSEFENPPAKAGESEIADFGRRLEQCGRRLDELWGGNRSWSSVRAHLVGRYDGLVIVAPMLERSNRRFGDHRRARLFRGDGGVARRETISRPLRSPAFLDRLAPPTGRDPRRSGAAFFPTR